MVVTGIVNVLNILGNYALIFGRWGCPQLGVEGAAIATAASRAVAMVLLACIHFKVHIPRFPPHYFILRVQRLREPHHHQFPGRPARYRGFCI